MPAFPLEAIGRPRLVDSAAGHVDILLLTVPSQVHDREAGHFRSLIESFGPDTTSFVLLHHEDDGPTVAGWRPAGMPDERWRQISTPFDLVIWAQDPYVAMTVERGGMEASVLVEGVLFRQSGMVVADEVVAGLALAGSPAVEAHQSFLFFEGGNILATPRRVLVGKDHLARNLGRPGLPDQDAVAQRFASAFCADRQGLLPVGTSQYIDANDRWGETLTGWFQPIFHVDMHVTPTGLVGTSGREILLYGTPAAVGREGTLHPEFRLQPAFDEVEELLGRHFELIRLPLLPMFDDAGEGWPTQHYYLTWNNVLVESFANSEGGVSRNVFMPIYDHPLDEVAAEVWRRAGFEVRRLSNMRDLAYAGGSAHCITKTLLRGPAPHI